MEFINENGISVYNEKTCRGAFRHIIVKYGMKTDDVMCVFVLGEDGFSGEDKLALFLVDRFPNIKTIVKNINKKNTNVILGDKEVILYGSGYIYDMLR